MRGGAQEMPPPGGFPDVHFARNVPARRGPTGTQLWVGGLLAVIYGFYNVGQTNIARREYAIEKRNARIAVAPFLQAEEDARYVVARKKEIEEEAKIMHNVPSWKAGASVYRSGKWMPSTM